jgi:ATP synthase F0 subunit c
MDLNECWQLAPESLHLELSAEVSVSGLYRRKSIEAIARQPEAKGDIMSTMILSIAFAEVTSLYALIVSILLIFVKWQ